MERAPGLGRLKRRPEFLAVAGTRRKWVAPGLILQVRRHDERQRPSSGEPAIRVGFTASRKVGGAVQRNRARRRLRAAVQEVLPVLAAPGHDFVIVARAQTLSRDFAMLKDDLETGLRRLGASRRQPDRAGESPA